MPIFRGALEGAGFDGFQEHGAAGREAGAIALGQLGRIALLKPGHTHQWVGVADHASLVRGIGDHPIG